MTGLPLGGLVMPAASSENTCTKALLAHLSDLGVLGRLEALLVDRGTSARAARSLEAAYDIRGPPGWLAGQGPEVPEFRPIHHAWRIEVAHGQLFRSRRLAKSFENTAASASGWLQVACTAGVLAALRTRIPA